MVRLQGDFAKPPEKRFNYKHCFDALFRVSFYFYIRSWFFKFEEFGMAIKQMVREEGFSALGRGVGPNVFRAVLMNASQLAS